MQTPLEKLFNFGAESAKHLFERFGEIYPSWIGVSKKGSHIPFIVKDMSNKDNVSADVKRFIKDKNIVRYVSMLECWIYEGKEVPREFLEGKSLEGNPDRREAIHILAEDNEGNTISGCFYILRPEHDKPKLSPIKMHDNTDSTTHGRFVDMFG